MGPVRRSQVGDVVKLTPATRQRVYQVLTAVLPIAGFYGLISDSEVGLWLTLAAAILGAGGTALAARHIPDAPDYVGRNRSGE